MTDNRRNRRAAMLLTAVLSVFSAQAVFAAPPGTQVSNTVSVTFDDSRGAPSTIISNIVVTEIAPPLQLSVIKSVTPVGSVPPGTTITFKLRVSNPSSFELTNVVIRDVLDRLLLAPTSFTTGSVSNLGSGGGTVSAAGSYDIPSRTLTWTIGSFPALGEVVLELTTTVDPIAPDDTVIRNSSSQLSDQDPTGTNSNEVVVGVVAPALSISLQANRSRLDVGDPVGYTVEVTNISPTLSLSGVLAHVSLPRGFGYMAGSSRMDGSAISDPVPSGGAGELEYSVGNLVIGQIGKITLVAVPTAEAENSDKTTSATARGQTPAGSQVEAGPAQVSMRVANSLLSSEAVLVGRIFVDDNRNGRFDRGEVGVPASRIYLEDGSFTFTDVLGKYHVEGVRPGLHVMKVDTSTLPPGIASLVSWSRSAGGAGTQFVDVGADQLFKSNIATGGWGLSVARLKARAVYRDMNAEWGERKVEFPPILAGAVFEPDVADLNRSARLVIDSYAALIRERGGIILSLEVEPESYPVGDEGLMQVRADRLRSELRKLILVQKPMVEGPAIAELVGPVDSPADGLAVAAFPPDGEVLADESKSPEILLLEARVRTMAPEAAVLSPGEEESVSADRSAVEITLPAGLIPRLTVNGEVIPDDQIAVRMKASITGVAFFRYLGVPFREGRNSVVLEGLDPWGNAREWVERFVNRAGPPRKISMLADDATLTADGRTPVEVKVDIRDSLGLAVDDGTLVTLDVSEGEIIGLDADPVVEGFQAVTKAGSVVAVLSPALEMTNRVLYASTGEIRQELAIKLVPEIRNWIVAGVGEAGIGTRGTGQGDDLSDLLNDNGGTNGRFAVFAKGRMFDASLMTFSYDSDREKEPDKIFRDLSPDRFFPIYGDSSVQGYEVEGQGKLSLRVDQPRATYLVGDFTSSLNGGELVRYDRALTGGAGSVNLQGFSVQSFAAETPQIQVRDEIDGKGTSGPYRLTRNPLVVNSERVVLETRDRFHPERVVSTRPMARYRDYDIDYLGGTLLFKRPVPFQDDSFNPVVIVIWYETLDSNGDETVAGGRVGYSFTGVNRAEVGTTYVNEGRQGGDYILKGLDLRYGRSVGRSSFELFGEAGTTQSASQDPAGAMSFRASGAFGKSVSVAGYYRDVSEGYENPSRGGSPDVGTLTWGIEGRAELSDGSRLKGEVFTQEDDILGRSESVRALDWERSFSRIVARSGLKDLDTLDPLSGGTVPSRLVMAGAGVKFTTRLDGIVQRQQVVSGAATPRYPNRTSLGLNWRVTDAISSFVKQEFDQSDLGNSSRTLIGMESHLTRNIIMDSRYSIEDSLGGERGAAQLGLRSRLPLNQDWLGDAMIERVVPTRSSPTEAFTSLGVGFEYLPARIKFTTRYELRLGETQDSHVLTAGGATRVTDALSLFTRQRFFFVNPDSSGSRFDGDGLLGLAYRPVRTDKVNFLFKLQGVKGSGAISTGSPEARNYLGIFEVNVEPATRLHLLGRLGYKDSRDRFEGTSYSSQSFLSEVRGLVDIGQRFNAGASVRLLNQVATESSLTGYGVEVGYMMVRDMWVVGGYNFTGFTEAGFGDSDRRTAGPFLSVRFKFDEETLVGLSQKFKRKTGTQESLTR